ncbi:MAG: repressor LexA [bacterium]|jgi:repressor LexA
MKEITDNQKVILEIVAEFIDDEGYPPTIRDIAGAYQCSVKGAYDHVLALEKKGYLVRDKMRSRGILLTDKADVALGRIGRGAVPLYGAIAAGEAIFADDNVLGTLNYPTSLPEGGEFFALQVKGDSMMGAGIFDGDTVVIRKQPKVLSGEIAACLIEDEATLKQVIYKEGKVILRSHNPKYRDRELKEKELRVLGKLHALFRQY